MPYYQFDQFNPGGFYSGAPRLIIVKADTAEEANDKALTVEGVYFDGIDEGIDCACCGDRWYRAYNCDDLSIDEVIGIFKTYWNYYQSEEVMFIDCD